MKKLIALAVLAMSASAFATDQAPVPQEPQRCEVQREAAGKEMAGQGCCSWHNGQCGCAGGRVQCCDGTQSPSCQCSKDDPQGVVN